MNDAALHLALAKFISKSDCDRPRSSPIISLRRITTMSGWVNARAGLRLARQFSRSVPGCPRPFSIWRQHDANIRAKKEAIRHHIRALEDSRRRFSDTAIQEHGHIDPPKPGEELHVTFIDKDGDQHDFEVAEGDNLLDIAQAKDLEMEGEES
jgi:hypothetical protein